MLTFCLLHLFENWTHYRYIASPYLTSILTSVCLFVVVDGCEVLYVCVMLFGGVRMCAHLFVMTVCVIVFVFFVEINFRLHKSDFIRFSSLLRSKANTCLKLLIWANFWIFFLSSFFSFVVAFVSFVDLFAYLLYLSFVFYYLGNKVRQKLKNIFLGQLYILLNVTMYTFLFHFDKLIIEIKSSWFEWFFFGWFQHDIP